MKRILITFAAAAMAAPLAAQETSATAPVLTEGERELAELLDGRIAGEPERCVRTFPNYPMRTIHRTALVFERGDTLWVNRTRDPDDIDDQDSLVIRKFRATQLCRLDQVTTIDRYNQFYTGNLFLTDFVPYRRVD